MISASLYLVLIAINGLAPVCFALSQKRHWHRISSQFQLGGKKVLRLRLAGCGCLIFSLWLTVAIEGVSFGIIFWTVLLFINGINVAMLLAFKPGMLRPALSLACHML